MSDAVLDVRMAPALERICNEQLTAFAFRGLNDALREFKCGAYEADGYFGWFWKTAPTWARKNSQAEFNTFARARLADKIGYTRKRNRAWGIVDALFDKEGDVTLSEMLHAIDFLCPQQPMPHETLDQNDVTFIDVTQREDSPKILKLDHDFAPHVIALYPWRRVGNQLLKSIPVGTIVREFDLTQFAFWRLYQDAEKPERENAIDFHNADPLDWRRNNMYSNWREGWRAQAMRKRFWKAPTEKGSGIISFNPRVLEQTQMTRREG